MRRLAVAGLCTALCVLASGTVFAQAPRDARLLVTVVDQSNAVLPNATVTLSGLADATRKATLAPVETAPNGIATIPGLVPGHYSLQAVFPGFDPGTLKDVRLRAGDNRQVIVLAIQKMQEPVPRGQDVQAGAADRKGSAFGTALTREQMDALSDDPDQMQRQREGVEGPGAPNRMRR